CAAHRGSRCFSGNGGTGMQPPEKRCVDTVGHEWKNGFLWPPNREGDMPFRGRTGLNCLDRLVD
ncbi:MAG: hypothetical protein OXC57_08020, partial [Rhodobacteraceae bacterium]|nr:hypothetical protein [Paracoccaceae bacterium]